MSRVPHKRSQNYPNTCSKQHTWITHSCKLRSKTRNGSTWYGTRSPVPPMMWHCLITMERPSVPYATELYSWEACATRTVTPTRQQASVFESSTGGRSCHSVTAALDSGAAEGIMRSVHGSLLCAANRSRALAVSTPMPVRTGDAQSRPLCAGSCGLANAAAAAAGAAGEGALPCPVSAAALSASAWQTGGCKCEAATILSGTSHKIRCLYRPGCSTSVSYGSATCTLTMHQSPCGAAYVKITSASCTATAAQQVRLNVCKVEWKGRALLLH